MPAAERERVGCSPEYRPLLNLMNTEEGKAAVQHCDEIREQFMVDRVVQFSDEKSSGLVLCGDAHAERLKVRLSEKFVPVRRLTVTDYEWFDQTLCK